MYFQIKCIFIGIPTLIICLFQLVCASKYIAWNSTYWLSTIMETIGCAIGLFLILIVTNLFTKWISFLHVEQGKD
jgi:hypothetical protein